MDQIRETKRIKRVTLLIFTVVLILLMTLLFMWVKNTEEGDIKRAQHSFDKEIYLSMNYVFEHFVDQYNNQLESLATQPEIITALKKEDQDALYALLEPVFSRWEKSDSAIRSLFAFPKDKSDIVTIPWDKSDTSSPYRPMVKKVHQTHKPLFGYDVCNYCKCYRVIVPVMEEEEYIGALELGFDPSMILPDIKEIFDYDAAMMVPCVEENEEDEDPSLIINGYKLISDGSQDIQEVLQQLKSTEGFVLQDNYLVDYKGKSYAFHFHTFDIKNYSGTSDIKIVLLQDVSMLQWQIFPLLFPVLIVSLLILLLFLHQIGMMQRKIRQLHEENTAELRENEARLHDFYENAADLYFSVDMETNQIIHCNRAFYRTLGFAQKKELIGKEFFSLFHEDSRNYVKNELLPRFMHTGKMKEKELVLRRKDGSSLYVSLYAAATKGKGGQLLISQNIFHDLSEIREAQKKLSFNASYLKTVFDTEPDILVTTYGEKIDRGNDAMLSFTGYKSIEAFKHDYDCICDMFENREGYLQRNMGELTWLEYIYAHPQKIHRVIIMKEGKEFLFHINANRLHSDEENRSIVVLHDITMLEEAEEELRQITTAAQDAICMIDNDGNIIFWNPAAERIFGYAKEEVIGKEFYRFLLSESDYPVFAKGFAHFRSTGESLMIGQAFEFVALHKKGHKIPVELSASALKMKGKWGAVGIIRDISDRVKMKEELQQKEELMISQSRQAAMGDMIAMIAHQWRQPLTVVAMAANNIKADIALGEPTTNEQLDKMSDDILYQTEHLSKTIDDFRDFFRPNQERTKTTLCKVLDDTMNIIGKSLQNNNIEVLISNTCTQEIETYPNQLLQVLLNLINNAKDALKELEQKNAKIDITIGENDTELTLTLCDNGGGIPEEILSRLGEPYVSSKVKSGTGLGIYMSKIIVEQHLGGILNWENRESGACFTITLPLKKGENYG